VNGLDHAAQVLTKHLAQSVVNPRRERSTSQALTEFRLDHVKRGFDVGSLVIVLQRV
jgi:hypothetical protein